MMRFYYYGCRGTESGHYLHREPVAGYAGYTPSRSNLDSGFPIHILDGTFAPLDRNDSSWKLTHLRFNGKILSFLACHDNTIDKRSGSNACFVVEDAAPWDEERILAQMKVTFPDCWERLTKDRP